MFLSKSNSFVVSAGPNTEPSYVSQKLHEDYCFMRYEVGRCLQAFRRNFLLRFLEYNIEPIFCLVPWGGVEPSPLLLGPLLAYCTSHG
jgi:hypothetical protein